MRKERQHKQLSEKNMSDNQKVMLTRLEDNSEYNPNSQEIKIKYFDADAKELKLIGGKSDWIDLRASEEVTLKKGDYALIPLGVAMELPQGYEAHIVPRSSTFKNFGLIQTNSCGVVDCTYCGDEDMWRMPVYAIRDTQIHVNDRICQFRIMENQPQIYFEQVDQLNNQNRGGFGTTGLQ